MTIMTYEIAAARIAERLDRSDRRRRAGHGRRGGWFGYQRPVRPSV